MLINEIIKRDNTIKRFIVKKISDAVEKAMESASEGGRKDAEKVKDKVVEVLEYTCKTNNNCVPTVEQVQDVVEESLMELDFFNTAKAYILYRDKQNRERKLDIFEKRINLKPYEYPELLEYVDAIRHSYWIHTEFNYTSDIQDFKVTLSDVERNSVRRTMLAISQIEVAVKTFWGNIYNHMPKPEIGSVGATFSESEVRHHDAYSHLLEILGLNEEFAKMKSDPIIMKRVNYLESAVQNSSSIDKKEYAESILLFSLFIEHVSLFSQFLIIMSFNKYKSQLKGISNVVEATSKEEQIHGNFGIDIINIIKKENPDWFDREQSEKIRTLCREAFESESLIVDWIFQDGDLDFLEKNVVKEFIKNRFNNSLESIGVEKVFEVNEKLVEESDWFDDEVIGTKHVDFFNKRSINYTKRSRSMTGDDLF